MMHASAFERYLNMNKNHWSENFGPASSDHHVCVYFSDVCFFANALFQEVEPYFVDVATVAPKMAPKERVRLVEKNDPARGTGNFYFDEVDYEDMRTKIRSALVMAAHKGVNRLVLCPVGCGFFKNPPDGVARAMYDELLSDGAWVDWRGIGCQFIIAVQEDYGTAGSPVMDAFYRHFQGQADIVDMTGEELWERCEKASDPTYFGPPF